MTTLRPASLLALTLGATSAVASGIDPDVARMYANPSLAADTVKQCLNDSRYRDSNQVDCWAAARANTILRQKDETVRKLMLDDDRRALERSRCRKLSPKEVLNDNMCRAISDACNKLGGSVGIKPVPKK
jgi:hypothetical protein